MSVIGKAGIQTSFVVRKLQLKKLLKGGKIDGCQDAMNAQIEGKHSWIQLQDILQNIPNKGIATFIGNISSQHPSVVVKVQLADAAKSEFNIQEKLLPFSGFIRYECMFTCDGDKRYVEKYSNAKDTKKIKLCRGKGINMGIIIMPYYESGSLEDVMKDNTGIDIINIIVSILETLLKAYLETGFTHGDLFLKNILLDNESGPVIIDYEKSKFDRCITTFWRDVDDFLGDVARFCYTNELNSASRVIMINRAYGIAPSDSVMSDLMYALKQIGKNTTNL